MKPSCVLVVSCVLFLSACGDAAIDPRGVEKSETLLSVSASGQSDVRPDEAEFRAGVQNWASDAEAASKATQEDITEIVAALRELGIAEGDIQTSAVNVQRIDWGDRRGQFQASNTLSVRVRDIDRAGAAVTAVTGVGANIVSGPDLRLSDPEAAANTAYANAYRAALSRAQAYAEAAGMEVSRVLYIRDAGGQQGNRWLAGAQATAFDSAVRTAPAAPPPVSVQAMPESMDQGGAAIMPGQTTSAVTVQVDFALVEH
ncbi:SIMPL domain-containing protein [Aurantiacibacter poecillastricola]|uniref:SIMPL domain-containing protein n=1 Tax=Aurantiacibacter poecillastricola TaxID=3064385 RepID=UPI00273DF7A5|nr:SIMPL domain-containing protein [Aurantiacibacter sp. 219JJ12-13]MDP5260119.1 SIMPL domain-containing protein [Aurantiacibacter sp. 219JJ12-13]